MEIKDKEFACDKLRRIVEWLDYQDESFNQEMKTISDIEKFSMRVRNIVWNLPIILTGRMEIPKMKSICLPRM